MKVRSSSRSRSEASRPGRGSAPHEARGESWEGALTVHPRGFGFVAAPGKDDVYVAPEAISGGMHGDRVRVSVVGRSARGVEGRVEGVVQRRSPRIAGLLRKRQRQIKSGADVGGARSPAAGVPLIGHSPRGRADC